METTVQTTNQTTDETRYTLSAKGREIADSPAFWAEVRRLQPQSVAAMEAEGWTEPTDKHENRATRRRMAREARRYVRAGAGRIGAHRTRVRRIRDALAAELEREAAAPQG